MRTSRFLTAIGVTLIVSACSPNAVDRVTEGRWANELSKCAVGWATFSHGEFRSNRPDGYRTLNLVKSIKVAPPNENTVAIELIYPNEPADNNKSLIVFELRDDMLIPMGLGSKEGYSLVTKRSDPFIQAMTFHKCP